MKRTPQNPYKEFRIAIEAAVLASDLKKDEIGKGIGLTRRTLLERFKNPEMFRMKELERFSRLTGVPLPSLLAAYPKRGAK